ncbi:MAG: BamA/TamA family outer membrane protein, partial [Bacteroidota bacterium]|nr:BamA/TamA family outer membrane protein [Bacteroidota bacterium]
RFHPHTSIKAGYNLQRRSYYNRSIFNTTFGYSWNSSEKKFFSFIPLDINYVNMNITDNAYQELINSMGRRIRYQMSDHFVMAMRYSYVYNGQMVNNKKNFNYFSFNIETSGNVLEAYSLIFNQSKNLDGDYTIFNIPFSQYIRTDFAFIRYNYITQKSSLVYKIYGGIGVPYGNAEALPYEKSFVAGGTNSLRGWQLRELGPGHSKPQGEMKYDRAGDIALGASIEYRFPLFGPFEGASFIDMGNIWTLNNVTGMEGGKISKDFYKEIASDIGLGLRLNAKVFILRVDFALKVWDPSKDLKERFVLDEAKFRDIAIQFGIGYPF